jgi:uncharacterized protein YbjT (DUF2867 family)
MSRLLTQRGEQVTSLIRNPDHASEVRAVGADPVVCDLESATEDEVAEAIRGADAVVFAAGAGPGSGPERKSTMDYGGAVKLIAAAKAEGIDRYVMISSYGADPDQEGDDTFAVYQQAKGKADEELKASGLRYTIVRPVSLNNDAGTGLVELAEHVERGQVPRDDVAAVLVALLHADGTAGKVLELRSGQDSIDQAVASVAGATA